LKLPGSIFDLHGLQKKVAELGDAASRPGFWDDQEKARMLTKALSEAEADIALLNRLQTMLDDARTLDELARELEDEESQIEAIEELNQLIAELDALDRRSLFFSDHDERDAIVAINPGAGGTESQDWAEMLLRMYLRYGERNGFRVAIEEYTQGEEAGLKSVTFHVSGRYAYGTMLSERGVHRLVRISPFDANARRHTSFSSVEVFPVLDDADDEIEIADGDLRIDTYRSSGAGGQHVNVTDSAVRITHLPTGIVASCQNERSQLQNKVRALAQLKAKLLDRARIERESEIAAIQGERADIAWGSQIRSYVLAPYQMIKDLRTGHESSDVNGVLDGNIAAFIEAWLRDRRAKVSTSDGAV